MAEINAFLNVHDIDASLAFYQALGFQVEDSYTSDDGELWYADLELDGAYLSLGAIEASEDPGYQDWVSSPLGAGLLLYVTVDEPDQVDQLHERAKKAGATIEHAPEDRPYGRVFTLNDPDGYVISFLATPD